MQFILLIYLLLLPLAVNACDFNDQDGLDVALVLSGGGAKASTQVGALQVLEEMEVPIHCILGTSMGAVVGALYASGYSADEIGTIFVKNNWSKLFAGSVQRDEKSYIEKTRENNYLSGNVAGFSSDGVKLPGGINSMQRLKGLYRDLLRDVPIDGHFDQLKIPFRAVATDLQNGLPKVFDRGDLVESILASMAVPGVFAPRKIDDRLYIDGGVSSNLPIRAARAMGADIIIAVDVSARPGKPDQDISVTETTYQLVNIMIQQNLQKDLAALKTGDLHWRPNTISITTAAYQRSAEGIKAGREYVLAQPVELINQIKQKAAPIAYRARGDRLDKQGKSGGKIVVNEVLIKNDSVIKNELIAQRSNIKTSDLNNVHRAERLRNELMAFGGFEEVDFASNSDGDLELEVEGNRLGRNVLNLGFNSSSDFSGESDFSFLAQVTRKPLSSLGGDVSFAGEFGTDLGLSASIYQPLGSDGRFFIQPRVYARWDRESLTFGDFRIGDYLVKDVGFQLGLGRELGTWGVLALQAKVNRIKVDDIVSIDQEFAITRESRRSLNLMLASDTLNRTDWPTSGHRLVLQAETDINPSSSERYEGSYLKAFSFDRLGILLRARYGTIKNKQDTGMIGVDFFSLGGFRQLGQFKNNSIPVVDLEYGSVEAFWQLGNSGQVFSTRSYIGAIAEVARVRPSDFFDIGAERDSSSSATLYYGMNTVIGPLFLGVSYGDQSLSEVFFKLGKTF